MYQSFNPFFYSMHLHIFSWSIYVNFQPNSIWRGYYGIFYCLFDMTNQWPIILYYFHNLLLVSIASYYITSQTAINLWGYTVIDSAYHYALYRHTLYYYTRTSTLLFIQSSFVTPPYIANTNSVSKWKFHVFHEISKFMYSTNN